MKEDHETNKEATLGLGIRRSPSTRRGDEGWKKNYSCISIMFPMMFLQVLNVFPKGALHSTSIVIPYPLPKVLLPLSP